MFTMSVINMHIYR